MTFSESLKLNEVLDKPLPYKETKLTSRQTAYTFITPSGKNGEVTFLGDTFDFTIDGRYSITNLGEEFVILSTVKAIVGDYIKLKNPDKLEFTGLKKEQSRIKLYKSFALMIEKLGYTSEQIEDEKNILFVFKKK